MMPLVSSIYKDLKSVLLNDSYLRAYNECPSVTKLSHKIWLCDKASVPAFLESNQKIDGVISIGSCPSVSVDQLFIDLKDCPFETNLITDVTPDKLHNKANMLLGLLNDVTPFINSHQNVLIHCTKGMSRSCFVYLFYKLRNHHTSYPSFDYVLLPMLKLLKARRTCCMIGDKFLYVLAYYEYLFIIKKVNDSLVKGSKLPSLN